MILTSNRTGTSVDDSGRKSNNWLDQWHSGKLGTGSRVSKIMFHLLEFSPYRALSRRSLLGDENGSVIFVSLAAWLSFPHAKLTAGGEGRVRNLAIECVSFFSFFPLILPTVLAFFHDQTDTLTQTRKARRQAERPKGDREQFTSLDFWITD